METLFEYLLNEDYENDFLNLKEDPYIILGFKNHNIGNTDEEIEKNIVKNYRILAKKYHPDTDANTNNNFDNENFKKLQAAYDFLKEKDNRTLYNQKYNNLNNNSATTNNKIKHILFEDILDYNVFLQKLKIDKSFPFNTFVISEPNQPNNKVAFSIDHNMKHILYVKNYNIKRKLLIPDKQKNTIFDQNDKINLFRNDILKNYVNEKIKLAVNNNKQPNKQIIYENIPLNEGNSKSTVFFNYKKVIISLESLSSQELQQLSNEISTNFQKTIAKYPYASDVVQSVENELTGKKYNSIGRKYNDSIEFFNNAKKRILESNYLREAQIDGSKLIDEIYKTPENLKWEDKDFNECLLAAKKGDKTAIGYIMYIMAPAIVGSYWQNYIGPSGKLGQIKINKDGGLKQSFLSWIGVALKALVYGGVATKRKDGSDRIKTSTLDGFDLSKVTGDSLRQFAVLFRRDLITQAKHINLEKKRRGLSGESNNELSIFSLNDFDNNNSNDAGERFASHLDSSIYYDKNIEDDVLSKLDNDSFKYRWLDFAQDEELFSGKVSPAKCFKILLEHPNETNLANLALIAGCSRNTFNTLSKKAISILNDYDIDKNTLLNAIDKYGTKKLASYLDS